MNILIDIGNSRLKWTLQQAARFEPQPEIAYRQENYLQLLTQCWLKLPMPEKLAISCVADPAVRAEVMTLAGQRLRLWCQKRLSAAGKTGCRPLAKFARRPSLLSRAKLHCRLWYCYYPGCAGGRRSAPGRADLSGLATHEKSPDRQYGSPGF